MKINKLLFIRQCDINGCKRIANFGILYDENNAKTQMCICKQCLDDITKEYKKLKTKTKMEKDDE